MQYACVKLTFNTGIHIGRNSLLESYEMIHADTFFSSLCHEILMMFGIDELELFIDKVKDGKLLFSDGLPYQGSQYFIPKPILYYSINDSSREEMKQLKQLKVIPVDQIENFVKERCLEGKLGAEPMFDLKEALNKQELFGTHELRTMSSSMNESSKQLYDMDVFHFRKGSGLYFLLGYESSFDFEQLVEVIKSLGYSGIGGHRSTGLGKFFHNDGTAVEVDDVPIPLRTALTKESTYYMSLTTSFPRDEELDYVAFEACYRLIKRSGYISSPNPNVNNRKKKDQYFFQSGSSFKHKYSGDLFDVSTMVEQKVYRYGKPIFIGL